MINEQVIESKIYITRGQKVMLDRDLAALYQTETKKLKQAIRRNINRFPKHFMFELTDDEQKKILRSQFVTLEKGKYSKYNYMAFTEHGIVMLASVLRSDIAVEVSVQIVRVFLEVKKPRPKTTEASYVYSLSPPLRED